jgi:Kdo2-lipid IVA lauroyltransferase/acyltransferase
LSGKFKITLIKLLAQLIALLPLTVIQFLGGLIGTCCWYQKTESARVTIKNIELCFPNLSAEEQHALAKRSVQEMMKTVLEVGKAWLAPLPVVLAYNKKITEVLDINAALARGKGIIVVAPHLGNWEILGHYLANRFEFNALYQPPKIAELDDFVQKSRGRVGTKLHPTDRRGILGLFKALRNGEVVGVLPDMEPPKEAGVYAPFFGIEALSMTLVSKLLQKTDATVVFAYAKRLPAGKGFEVVMKAAPDDIYSEDIATSVAALNQGVEACVEAAVEQYQWEYKRFKHKPGGKTRAYKF